MNLRFDSLTQPVLEIPADASLAQRCQSIADPAARWQIYLHELGRLALSPWIQDSSEVAPQVWPEAAPWAIWQVVSGLGLKLGQRRVVVIISEAIDTAALRVAKEWVDIPGWAGDYYLAAQIDIDEQQLRLWGYATYHQIKRQAAYDHQDRTYCLKEVSLIQDFSAFWVAQQLEELETPAVETVETVETLQEPYVNEVPRAQAEQLLSRLANALEPRLEIPFSLWSTLLKNPSWRRSLYTQRQHVYLQQLQQETSRDTPINLGDWASQLLNSTDWSLPDQMLAAGWQTLASRLTPALAANLPANFRADVSVGSGHLPAASCGKSVALIVDEKTVELVLTVSLKNEADNRSNIQIRLYPDDQTPVEREGASPLLPASVTLALQTTETGETLQTVCSGDRDNYIQLPAFRCMANQPFSVCVQHASATAVTHFLS